MENNCLPGKSRSFWGLVSGISSLSSENIGSRVLSTIGGIEQHPRRVISWLCFCVGRPQSVALGCQFIIVLEGNLSSFVSPLRQQQKMNMCLFCPFQCARNWPCVNSGKALNKKPREVPAGQGFSALQSSKSLAPEPSGLAGS